MYDVAVNTTPETMELAWTLPLTVKVVPMLKGIVVGSRVSTKVTVGATWGEFEGAETGDDDD